MDTLREAILDYRSNAKNSDILISELNALVDEHGLTAAQLIFQVLASLDFPTTVAGEYWKKVLEHRESLSSSLKRKVDLLPALCDFFSTYTDFLSSPKLIETSTFTQIVKETTHDNLTSLFNRPYFDGIFEDNISLAKRYATDLSILFLDVDNFKDINDTYGHSIGDVTLQKIASIIKEEKRASDIAARYGGEEFVLLMPHTENLSAFVLAERIRTRVEAVTLTAHGKQYSVTISGGLASYPLNSKDSRRLLDQADSALYLAKGAGKNTISLYKEEKRRYLRVKFNESIQIKELGFTSSRTFSGTGKDICIGGILFQNKQAFPIGSRIQVSIPFHDSDPLLLIGTVVRLEAYSENSYDIGMTISFKEMDKIANNEIANFLRKNLTEKL